MTNKFRSSKSKGFGVFLLIVCSIIVFIAFGLPLLAGNFTIMSFLISAIIAFLAIGLIIWFRTSTNYLIVSDNLIVNSGPLHRTIPIGEIKTIRIDQNTIGGIIKPALSLKCLEITYGNDKLISISPENQDNFLSILKERNNAIEIK